jgi:uncharacterized SAM-binding protein YcdF (DUF218 family)
MLLFLSKLIQVLLYPVGLSVALAVAGGIVLLVHKRKAAIVLIFSSIAVLCFFSSPLIVHSLVRGLESKYDPPADFPKASAIVLLGGCTRPAVAPRRYSEPSTAGDRMINAARLFRKGYAPVVVATGGKISFFYNFPGSEATCMASILQDVCGVDSSAIIIEDKAQDTHDNATNVAALFQQRGLHKDIILVTSAMHMYRSVKIFRKCGFTVYPAPADYRADKAIQKNILSLLPSVDALSAATDVLHEYYGLIAYKIMGWL